MNKEVCVVIEESTLKELPEYQQFLDTLAEHLPTLCPDDEAINVEEVLANYHEKGENRGLLQSFFILVSPIFCNIPERNMVMGKYDALVEAYKQRFGGMLDLVEDEEYQPMWVAAYPIAT